MKIDLDITNIAGISEGSATIKPGVNTVQASNWQGKSSFIRAIETAYGTKKPLTEGVREGRVTIDIDGTATEVRLQRQNRTVTRQGTPVLDDEYDQLLVDLFAFLGEDNEIRRAVRNGEDLEELLTRPLEIEDIDARIADLQHERDAVESELERARRKTDELVSLEQRENELESELADLREQEAELEDAGTSDAREELSDLRAERERVTDLIERLENTLERSRDKLSDAHDEYETIDVEDAEDIEEELASVREQYDQAETDLELLQSVYSANKRLVEEDRLELLADIDHGMLEDAYGCWLCGSETSADEIESHLDAVGEEVLSLRKEVRSYEDRIESLEDKRDEIKRQRRRKADLDDRIADLESTITERSENLSSAEERLASIEEQIAALEENVEDADREVSDLRSDIKYKEAELSDLREEIEAAKSAADQVDTLEAEQEQLTDEIADLRARKDEIQNRIRESFDESIQTIVSRFETSFETARLTSEFELVVARDGREVGLDALSEGEVELIGIVTAIAGFEAYDVADVTSIVLLDQLGGLADDNLVTLADYLEGLTDAVVFTAYPENTAFGDNQIDPSEWKVVSAARAMSA